jgi:hypothetical protein
MFVNVRWAHRRIEDKPPELADRDERSADEKPASIIVPSATSEALHRTTDLRSLPAAALLDLQRSAGNQAVARLLGPLVPLAPDRRETVRRWFDEDTWMLPEEEQTFEGWLETYWAELDWISQDDYDEVERLYELLFKAQGDEEEARAAHDAAYDTMQASYLELGSDAFERAVAKAADTIESSGQAADAEAIGATWPGRNPDDVPVEYQKAVGDEVRQRADLKHRAESDKKEAERQQAAADAKAIRDRQTRRVWTGKQVIRTCGYGGKTSVHPYWGGRSLMINQQHGFHFTQFQDNYDSSAAFAAGTDIQTVIDAVFGGKGGQNCLHVTQEVFGPVDRRNPHYFFSGVHTPAAEKSKTVKEKGAADLKALIDNEKQRITNLLRLSGS